MTSAQGVDAGARDLAVLAGAARPAGSAAERVAQEHVTARLRGAGYEVRREPFGYSAFPGRYATPIGGALGGATVLASCVLGIRGASSAPGVVLAAGCALTAIFAFAMLGDAVLTCRWMRRSSANLTATRGSATPRVWLVAHVDSKSQPVPSAARVAGFLLLVAAIAVAASASALQLAGMPLRTPWIVAALLAVAGALPVMSSVVGSRSPGAVDNASGVCAVLGAACLVNDAVPLGVLITSAEELGLAGARAWVKGRERALALNCDGVDDMGELTVMTSGTPPAELLETLRRIAPGALRTMRMPLGLLTDSVAFTDAGWSAVTLSRGSLKTLARIHTPNDSLAALRGDAIPEMSTLLARAAEALA